MTMPKGWSKRNNRDTPKTGNIEEKKWIVSRIDYFLQETLEETQAAKDYLIKRLTENHPKTIDRRRNKILAGIGFAVTLLVSIKDFSQMAMFKDWLLTFVIVGLSAAGITFFLFTELSRQSSKIINQIDLAFINFMTNMYILKGALARTSLSIDNLTLAQLHTFHIFAVVCTFNKIELNDLLNKAFSMYVFRSDRVYLKSLVDGHEILMTRGYWDTYKNYEKQIKQEQLLKDMLPLIAQLLNKFQESHNSPSSIK
jgi:hypothetical protein